MSIELEDDAQDAVSRLFALINLGDSQQSTRHLALLEEALEDAEEDEADAEALLYQIKEIIDWEAGFYVDWKDVESFIGCLNQLCERIDLEIDWGTDDPEDEDFLEGTSVPELMELATDQLRVAGYTLWNWDTGGDAYAGWITRSEDDDEMLEIAETLAFDLRSGDQPY